MASTCIHDSHQVCASTPDGCTRRSFLDQCDMYEYNCDYGTHETDDITHTKISQTTNDFTSTSVETSLTDNTKGNDSTSDDKINYDETNETSDWITQEHTEITESIHTETTENENTQRRNQICCNRPLTWETTTELTNIITHLQTGTTIKEDSESSSKENTNYIYDIDSLQTLPVVSEITIPDKNISPYATTKKPSTKPTDRLLSVTDDAINILSSYKKPTRKCKNGCQRPLTWFTTAKYRRKAINSNIMYV
ncbi:unnamed protein product [Danaus chrysippus]|uniref:(African queen) hypothetical protein n=1 Tax=Danaus chrysippus TaxID=151541 RepID=A0A8J2QR04_9NEOP|nr:unnamed protein product [Danaus chrysippus]